MEQKERLEFYAGNTEAALEKYLPKSDKHYAVLIDAMRYSLLGGLPEQDRCAAAPALRQQWPV